MAYCGPRGIPDSHFLGGPLVWTDLDREKALAWSMLDRATCKACGTRKDEWNPERGGDRRAYVAEIDECPGCVHVERQQQVLSTPEWKGRRGLRVILRRR